MGGAGGEAEAGKRRVARAARTKIRYASGRSRRKATAEEEAHMPYYLIQASYKESAAKALIARPHDRSAVVKKMLESLGGKLHSFFLAFGDYDVVAIVEAPDNASAVAAGLATVSGGAISKYKTTVLISPQEAVSAMKKAKKIAYTPPK
jgi:uncharacterized protein with GYD domain